MSLEASARVRVPFAGEYYDQLKYEFDPSGRYRLKPNQKLDHIQINSLGFRGRAFSGSETILLLGDSVTFGVGASSDEHIFSRYLEKALGEDIADASVRAYRVYQQYSQLPVLLNKLPKIKQVLLWCGYADLLYWVITGGQVEGAFRMDLKYQDTPFLIKKWQSMIRKMGTFIPFGKQKSKDNKKGIPAQPVSQLVDHLMVYILAIQNLCSGANCQLHVLIQPFVRTSPHNKDLKVITDGYSAHTERKCGMTWYSLCDQFLSLLKSRVENNGQIDFMDCQQYIEEDDFLDQVHLKQESLEKIAYKWSEEKIKRSLASF